MLEEHDVDRPFTFDLPTDINEQNFAGLPEDQLANMPPEVRQMVMTGTTAMMNGVGAGMGGGMGSGVGPGGLNPNAAAAAAAMMNVNPGVMMDMGMMGPMGMGMNGDMGMGNAMMQGMMGDGSGQGQGVGGGMGGGMGNATPEQVGGGMGVMGEAYGGHGHGHGQNLMGMDYAAMQVGVFSLLYAHLLNFVILSSFLYLTGAERYEPTNVPKYGSSL